MSTATEAVAGAMRQTGRKRTTSRHRRRSGLMLRVTIAPQKMRISRAPARANSTAVERLHPARQGPGEVGGVGRQQAPGGTHPDRGEQAEDERRVDGDRHLEGAEVHRDGVPVPGHVEDPGGDGHRVHHQAQQRDAPHPLLRGISARRDRCHQQGPWYSSSIGGNPRASCSVIGGIRTRVSRYASGASPRASSRPIDTCRRRCLPSRQGRSGPEGVERCRRSGRAW